MIKQLHDRSESASLRDILIVPGGGHIGTYFADSYTSTLSEFFKKCKMLSKSDLEAPESGTPALNSCEENSKVDIK
jgi:hypothetical protein